MGDEVKGNLEKLANLSPHPRNCNKRSVGYFEGLL